MYQENICEEAIREERTRIAGELDMLLQGQPLPRNHS
jgi:hypothetical protein